MTKYAVPLIALFASVSFAQDAWTKLDSMDQFEQRNGTATYVMTDGVIKGTTAEGSPNSFLCTKELYGDFELEFEVKVDDALNSGVQIRSNSKGGTKDGRVNGPQVEIESTGAKGAESGYIYGEACGGWMTPKDKLIPHKHFKNGEWNSYRIVAKGANIKTWVNGNAVSDLIDEEKFKSHPKGFFGFQVHSIKKGKGPYSVEWRNLRVKSL